MPVSRPQIYCHLEREYGTVRRCEGRFAVRDAEKEAQV